MVLCVPIIGYLLWQPGLPDHAAISVTLEPDQLKVKKPFRFYNFLIQSLDFLSMVVGNWFSFNVTGFAMFRVSKKLKMLKNCIREFSHQNYSSIEKKTVSAHENLLTAQSFMLADPPPANAERMGGAI